jgi:Protein of unknown function (DUF445)
VVESGARALADQFHDELAGLVTGTIERWDAAETSSQLELLLGPDLQWIRINGTVVGAIVGLAVTGQVSRMRVKVLRGRTITTDICPYRQGGLFLDACGVAGARGGADRHRHGPGNRRAAAAR